MALSATATQGFELIGYVEQNQPLWVPGDPGDTFTKGDCVTMAHAEGVLDPAAADEPCYGVVLETVVCPASTTGFPVLEPGVERGWGQVLDDELKTLVQILPLMTVGTPIFKVTFADQTDDENITAYTAGDPSVTVAAVAADDDHNGGFIYCYGGTGIGQWNVIADSTASSNKLTLHRIFETALDTTSDVIYFPGDATTNSAASFFGRVTQKTAATVDVSDGEDDGDWTIFADARGIGTYLNNLTLPVVPSGAFLMA